MAISDAAKALTAATFEGHTCVWLTDLPGGEAIRGALFASALVQRPGDAAALPLLLDDDGRLYLQRYYDYERRLAERIVERTAAPIDDRAVAKYAAPLAAFFPPAGDAAPNWQTVAAALALVKRLAVISGGPGTGKTTTVVGIMACLAAADPRVKLALAAPTGKAAARMIEAIARVIDTLPREIAACLPTEAFTVHRLLGASPLYPGRFRHHAGNPLAIDALIVDEGSMLDLALATHLFEAVPRHARLILLGDQHQLAAVEAGAVFGTLAGDRSLAPATIARIAALTGIDNDLLTQPAGQGLSDAAVWLTRNYRFGADSAIGRLAGAINAAAQDPAQVFAALAYRPAEAGWSEIGEGRVDEPVFDRLMQGYAGYIAALQRHDSPENLLDAFESYRVLCALREGPRGAGGLNERIALRVQQAIGLTPGRGSAWFSGRPVIVTENDYSLRLFNGDIGIAIQDRAGYLVWFPDRQRGLRAIATARLPAHETAFALTVHKAQGSEFDHVALVLPSKDSPVMTRELVYTAVTRARRGVQLYGSREVLAEAVRRPTRRDSGLLARLREQQRYVEEINPSTP